VNDGAGLASWTPLITLLVGFAVIVAVLVVAGGRSPEARGPWGWLQRVPAALEQVTGIPGWAAGMIGTAAFGLLMAGIGFYNDVAWHVGLGRDKQLFTAPHTMIVVGLGFITLAAGVGITFATATRAEVGTRVRNLRVPWSSIPLGLLGLCALLGFPLDDFWHKQYGIDVTMWSPTHMLMILGASLSLVAAWLALAEADVPFRAGPDAPRAHRIWARIVHLVAAWFVLAGLTSALGEFRFGVPQFQQLYHPVLLCLASAFTFVAVRIVLGAGWSLVVAVLSFLPEALHLGASGSAEGFVPTRGPGIFVASALAVELVALVLGTERRVRFAVCSGVGVATLGLAGEFWWNADAIQPWTSALLLDAVLIGAIVAIGAAVVGAAYGSAVAKDRRPIRRQIATLWALAVVVGLLVPLPRRTGLVDAQLTVDRQGDEAVVTVVLDPQHAAERARWFQAIAWQGGGLVVAGMDEVEPGTYVSDGPLPVTGSWKTLIRLHTGDELMSVPVYLPADPEIGAPEIPAVDRHLAFGTEQQYLMREVKAGPRWYSLFAYAVIAGVAVVWAGSFVVAASKISPTGAKPTPKLRRLLPRGPSRGSGQRGLSPGRRPWARGSAARAP
jgi:hypothetical protein